MKKNDINYPQKILEDQIPKFLQEHTLTNVDLERIDVKLRKLITDKNNQDTLKSNLTSDYDKQDYNIVKLPDIETISVKSHHF